MRDELVDVLSLIVMCLLLILAFKIIVVIIKNEAVAREIIDFLRQLFM
jgi:hypothetical protein